MDHGVTAAQSRAASKRASEVESRSSRSISAVKEMIDDYETEVEAFKGRIAVMQMAEVERLQKEIAYREELAANHGKPKSFWKVPALNTLKRRHDRKESDSSGAQFLRPLRLTKSQHRPNKFDLDENTLMLKKLL